MLVPTIDAKIIEFDVSGAAGNNATAGTSYSHYAGASYSEGSNGGDAGHSTKGKHASNIEIFLKDIEQKSTRAVISITGKVGRSNVNKKVTVASYGQIHLLAKGGKGGDGGIGGDGEGGCNGPNGSDATEYSSGTSGGNGCGGGEAGDGTPGSKGGNGGIIKVHLPIEDVYLSLLVEHNVLQGDGGGPGTNGTGGQGGNGGSGGSSHSWTTTHPDGESCSTYTSDNGNGSYSTHKSCTPKYRTESHYQSGGSDGFDGPSGSNGSGNISGGADGKIGDFKFVIHDKNGGKKLYNKAFELFISSYTLIDENEDGVFEPGEKVTISNITIKNRNKMPSPYGKANFTTFLNSSQWIIAGNEELVIPRLGAYGSVTLKKKLTFRLKHSDQIGQDVPLVFYDTVTPSNKISKIGRTQQNFSLTRNITITYPVEITKFYIPESVGSGEKIKVYWKIKNISSIDYGGEAEIKRKLSSSLRRTGGDATGQTVSFIDASGANFKMPQGFLAGISRLRSGEEMIVEGILEVSKSALPYTNVVLSTQLNLQKYHANKVSAIQENTLSLRISRLYSYTPGASLLLITNSATTREEYTSWLRLTKAMGLIIDIWDISYYGYLSLINDLSSVGASGTLMNNYANKTIIMLNNSHPRTNEKFIVKLKQAEFLQAAMQKKTNFYILGGQKEEMNAKLTRLLLARATSNHSFENEKEYFQKKEKMPTDSFKTFVKSYNPFSSDMPPISDLKQQASDFSDKLLLEDPRNRYVVRYKYNPSLLKKSFIASKFHLGDILVTNTLTPGLGKAVMMPLDEGQIHRKDFIEGNENFRGLLLAMSTTSKIELLLHQLEAQKDQQSLIIKSLKDAIIYDLITEIDREESYSFAKDFKSSQYNFYRFIQIRDVLLKGPYQISQTVLSSTLSDIFAALNFYLYILPGIRAFSWDSLAHYLSKSMNETIEEISGVDAKAMENQISDKTDLLQEKAEKRMEILTGIKERDNARNMLLLPSVHRTQTTEMINGHTNLLEGY